MLRILEIKLIVLFLVLACQYSIKNSRDKIEILNDDSLKISYIGNMGVLMENKDQTVLIDGFHKKYKPAYAYPSQGTVDGIIAGTYPEFTQLEINLITHKHKDHFNPEQTLDFLRANEESLTICPDQVKEALVNEANGANKILERVMVIDMDNESHSIEHQGILIKSIRCDHTYQTKHKEIQNIAHIIDINGYKILHVGDTEWGLSKGVFEKLKLTTSNIDIAILPYWMLLEESSVTNVKQFIKPNMVVASHIDPNTAQQIVNELQVNFPDVVGLTELNKTIKFKK